jgi:hypothetical protein
MILRRLGWDVIYLGASVPVEKLEETLTRVYLQLAIFSAQQLITAATLRETAKTLHNNRVPLAFGGRIFNLIPGLSGRITGHFLGEDLQNMGRVAERLLTTPQQVTEAQPVSNEYQKTLAIFRERQRSIEAAVWEAGRLAELSNAEMRIASDFLSNNIAAALTLGDIGYLEVEISWIDGLLGNRKVDQAYLTLFLSGYCQALVEVLGDDSRLIVDWFNQEVLES